MPYGLGVDLGTTYTAAAVSDASGTRAIQLGRELTVSSVVFATEGGVVITGDAAETQAGKQPQRASRTHKRRLADPTPLSIGGTVRSPASLMAAQLRDVVAVATATQGYAPSFVVLTCPAVWGPYRREHFVEVPRLAGLENVRIITEPEAAAMHYSVERRLGEGEVVGVYDIGGGTFDATVLRARSHGMEILGTPEGVERLGGIDFDDSLMTFLDGELRGEISRLVPSDPHHALYLHDVREASRKAKEALSSDMETAVRLNLPSGACEIVVSRKDLNDVVAPSLRLTIDAFARTIASARLRPENLAAVLLAGGSSQIPLVAETVSSVFGKPVRLGLHPKLAVALGAAAIARSEAHRLQRPAPQSIPPNRIAPPPPRPAPTQAAVAPPVQEPLVRIGRRGLTITAAAVAALVCAGLVTAVLSDSAQTGATPVDSRTAPSAAPASPEFLYDDQDTSTFHGMIGSEVNWAGTPLDREGRAAHPALTVTATDMNGKGDGHRARWTGNGAGQFYLQAPQSRLDARPIIGTGTLTFDVVVTTAPVAQVSLASHCHYPCQAPLNATALFRRLPPGTRTTVRVPLSCFTEKGLDPSNVDVPFLVHTAGTFEATFARVRWEAAGTKTGEPVTPCADLT